MKSLHCLLRFFALLVVLVAGFRQCYAAEKPTIRCFGGCLQLGKDSLKTEKTSAPPLNTLLTAVVTDQYGTMKSTLAVRIYRNGVRIAEVIPNYGLVAIDLAGKADARDVIEVVVWPERFGRHNRHEGKRIRTNLAHAQNLLLAVDFTYPHRRGQRTLYINDI